jgi:mycofactocin system creatininase family protein
VIDQLADLSWPEIHWRSARDWILAIPVGSTEQHGPHLPLSTDTDIAVVLCSRLAEHRGDVLVAPAMPYGSSGEHAGFAGTLSIGQAAIEQVVLELVRSATDTFRQVLLVSAHGGNGDPVSRAVATLRAESRDVLLFQPRWSGDAHAGGTETAVQLFLRPQLVAMDCAARGDTRPLAQMLPELRRGGVRAVSPNGVLGDPTGATPGEGRAILARLADDLAEQVVAWRSA